MFSNILASCQAHIPQMTFLQILSVTRKKKYKKNMRYFRQTPERTRKIIIY